MVRKSKRPGSHFQLSSAGTERNRAMRRLSPASTSEGRRRSLALGAGGLNVASNFFFDFFVFFGRFMILPGVVPRIFSRDWPQDFPAWFPPLIHRGVRGSQWQASRSASPGFSHKTLR